MEEKTSSYEADLRFAREAEQERKSSRKILRKRDWQSEETRHTIYTELISPGNGFHIKTLTTFIGEIVPGGVTGMHRHANEAAIYILSGRGYSIVDDERIDWEEGDSLCIPMMAWHQHFNGNKEKPARYLAAINEPLMKYMGLFMMEQREDKKF